METLITQYSETIRHAAETATPLCVRGSGSKDFYGGEAVGAAFDVSGHKGILTYEPSELVLTARGGTPLEEIEALLAQNGQMLAFEPPHFGPGATLGGCVATGLSGPRRAYSGAVRDFVLGVRMIDGRGDDLRFGGQVMKNVAGYDVSRLMAGSLGTLGVLLEVSLKVLPRPAEELTLRLEMDARHAIDTMNRWAGLPLPLSATAYHDGVLTLRLSGAESAVAAAHVKLGGETVANGPAFWHGLREQTTAFFRPDAPLWRLSLPSATPPLEVSGRQLIEWGGALRWLSTDQKPDAVRDTASRAGGHATLFRANNGARREVFQPLAPAVLALHQRLKNAFDPHGIFNPGKLFTES